MGCSKSKEADLERRTDEPRVAGNPKGFRKQWIAAKKGTTPDVASQSTDGKSQPGMEKRKSTFKSSTMKMALRTEETMGIIAPMYAYPGGDGLVSG